MLCAVLWVGIVVGDAVAQAPEPAPVAPNRVTTDSPEYCRHLAQEYGAAQRGAPVRSNEADWLAAEGRRMCEHGLLPGGIARLRRALLIVRGGP